MRKEHIHIIGGGVIGLCSALYLLKDGVEVTIVEKGSGKSGTSFGNAGMIVPSHFIPMAAPGVMSQGLKWMFDNKSPFYIKPRLNADLIQWVWNFARSSTAKKSQKAMPALFALNEKSKHLYKEMVDSEKLDVGFEERGLLMLYKTHKQALKEAEVAEKAYDLGVETSILNSEELKTLEPNVDFDAIGGCYFPGDAHLSPHQLMIQLKDRLHALGANFITDTEVSDFRTKNGSIDALVTAGNEEISVDRVLVTSGCWSAKLLKKIGVKLLLQDGKGYSVTVDDKHLKLRIPTILTEAKVAITPMGNKVRIGGTLELSGMSEKINHSRVDGILESISHYYKNASIEKVAEHDIWKGYRPCTPDGLPYLGKSNRLSNLYVGTGHGMMGLSLGAVSGKLLAEIITGQKTSLDISSYELDRF